MNVHICEIVLLVGVVIVSSSGCPREKAYHRTQASRISEARSAMGGAGSHAILVNTEDGYRNRVELNFRDRPISDKDLEHLRGLDGIVGLDLSGTDVTDEGLAVLSTLPDLEYLQLADTGITSRGISHLAEIGKLKMLDLRRTRIDGDARSELRRMPSLEKLYTKGTPINDIDGIEVDSQNELTTYWGEGAN